jgi:hypothetical protein
MRVLFVLAVVACGPTLPDAERAPADNDPHVPINTGDTVGGDEPAGDPNQRALTCAELTFTPCGGDVVGTWSATLVCPAVDTIYEHPDCATSLMSVDASTLQVTRTFNEDGTYVAQGSGALPMAANITTACAVAYSHGYLTLADVCAMAPRLVQLPEGSSMNCVVTDDECVCAGVAVVDLDESGTYTVAGTALSMSGQQDPIDYCVQDAGAVFLAQDALLPIEGAFVAYQ